MVTYFTGKFAFCNLIEPEHKPSLMEGKGDHEVVDEMQAITI